MSNTRITDLTAIVGSNVAPSTDVLAIEDISANTTNKVTVNELFNSSPIIGNTRKIQWYSAAAAVYASIGSDSSDRLTVSSDSQTRLLSPQTTVGGDNVYVANAAGTAGANFSVATGTSVVFTVTQDNAFSVAHATRTSDASTKDTTITSQAAYASATGSNRNSGNIDLVTPASASGGTAGQIGLKANGVYALRAGHDNTLPFVDFGASVAKFGTTPATTGTQRLQNGWSIYGRGTGAVDRAALVNPSGSDLLYVGSNSAYDASRYVEVLSYPTSGIWLGYSATTVLHIDSGGLRLWQTSGDTGSLTFGNTGAASTGTIRTQNISSWVARSVSGLSNFNVIETNSSDQVLLGGSSGVVSLVGTANEVICRAATHYFQDKAASVSWLVVDTNGVNFGASVIKQGATPASAGDYRTKNVWKQCANNFLGTGDIEVIQTNASDQVVVGDAVRTTALIGYAGGYFAWRAPTHYFQTAGGSADIVNFDGTGISSAKPIIGYLSPYAVHGTGIQAVTSGGTVVVSAAVYKYRTQRLTGVLTGVNTLVLYPPATAATSYMVPFNNTTTGAFLTTIGANDGAGGTSAVGATVTLALNTNGTIMFDERGATLFQ